MPLENERIQALCFDVDGTLRDTDEQYVVRLEKLLRPFRSILPHQDAHKTARRIVMTIDTPINAVYTILDWLRLDEKAIHLIDWLQERHLREAKKDLPLVPGVKQSLDSLAAHYPLAVISARGERGTQEFLEHHQLTPYFRCVVSGQTTTHTKPWPDPVFWAADKMDVSPKACVMIGDTTVDIRAGRTAGAQTIGVLSGFGDEKELARVQANLILPSVAELPVLLNPDRPRKP